MRAPIASSNHIRIPIQLTRIVKALAALCTLLRPPRQQKAPGRATEGILVSVKCYRGNRTAVRGASTSRYVCANDLSEPSSVLIAISCQSC